MKSKNNTKALLILVCILLLIVSSSLGTLAYLTDTQQVENTFTMGQVRIRLDEAHTDEDGNPIKDHKIAELKNAWRTEKGNKYHLIPGSSYTKDPTVTVLSGSEPAYIRVLVTFHGAKELHDILCESTKETDSYAKKMEHLVKELDEFLNGWEEDLWIVTSSNALEAFDTLTVEFRFHKTVSGHNIKGEESDVTIHPVFTGFTLPGKTTGAQMAALEDAEFEITVVGQAIQAENFDNANEAWKAFEIPVEPLTFLPDEDDATP